MSQMTIGKRLTIGFGAILIAALGVAGSAIYWVGNLGHDIDEAVNRNGKKLFLTSQLQATFFRMRSCQRGVMLFAMHKLPDKVRANKDEFESRANAAEVLLGDLKPLLATDEGRRLHAGIETDLAAFRGYFERVAAASLAGQHQEALRQYTDYSSKSLDSLDEKAARFQELMKELMDQDFISANQHASKARWMSIVLALLALLVSPAVLMAIQRTNRELRNAATELADGSAQIAGAASQVAASSGSLAQGASEQAASLEETSASAEEITSMTRKNAENSRLAAEMMSAVDQKVQEGNRTLDQMVGSMQEINASSDKISKIIKVIDEIAFQTNILALNAAVEAARAGEAGMGFAVVADEVRNLAQRSAQAAKDTAAMIEESISKSSEGSAKLQKVTQVIRAITDSAAKVKTLVDEVNLGSQEQARGIEQISKAVAQMDRVTQTTAASAEESASASEELSAQAEALKQIVTQLQSMVGGGTNNALPGKTGGAAGEKAAFYAAGGDIAALHSAIAKPAANLPASKAPAADAFPLEDTFVEH